MRNGGFRLVIAVLSVCVLTGCGKAPSKAPIRVGVLHSLTGTMALSEQSVIDATLMAVEEINARGGLLGRKLEAVVLDGKSHGPTFARQAERLITAEDASVVFGCWTSASRRSVKPVFEQHNSLLFYPVQYEGIELSPNIVYTGAAPNQQIIPAVEWCFRELRAQTFFLVGSDYVFPRTAHAIIRDEVERLGGKTVGDAYVLLESTDFRAVVDDITAKQPDVILNCINGAGNIAFFEELRSAGVTPSSVPTVSFSIAEDELRSIGTQQMVGDYCAWNYFQSVGTETNEAFVARFQRIFGRSRVTDDPMEAGYVGVHLWAQAVMEAGTTETTPVRDALAHQTFAAPEGLVSIDPASQHTCKPVRIGRIRADGQFDIVWASAQPVRPEPYPQSRSREEWDAFLADLYNGWGQRWANPGK